jgi:hypothetical protein
MWFCEECGEPNSFSEISCRECGEPGMLADAAAEWVLLRTTPIDVDTILEFLLAGCDPFQWFEIDWENDWTVSEDRL